MSLSIFYAGSFKIKWRYHSHMHGSMHVCAERERERETVFTNMHDIIYLYLYKPVNIILIECHLKFKSIFMITAFSNLGQN